MYGENSEETGHRTALPRGAKGGNKWKGVGYEAPEAVPDQYADMNEVPPESVVETSHFPQ